MTSGNATSLQGKAVSGTTPSDGYVLTYVSANSDWEPKAATGGGGSFTAGGDLSGTSSSQTVIKLQGNAVASTTLGSTQDGYVLTWVNGSTNIQAKPPTSAFTTVSVGTTPSLSGLLRFPGAATTQMAFRNNANSADLAIIATDTSNQITFGSLGGGATTAIQGATTVQLANGTTNTKFSASGMLFSSATAGGISQSTPTTDVATSGLTITSQAPFASAATNLTPGNLVLTVPSPVGAGASGKIQHSISGTVQGSFISGGLELGTNPAQSQTLRLPNGNTGGISSRNAANTGDFIAYKIDGTNAQYFGDSTSVGTVIQSGASGIYLRPSGTTAFSITASAATFVSPIVQIGTTPSTTGNLALPASFTIKQRNNANTADLSVLSVDATDNLTFGSNLSGVTTITAANTLTSIIGSTTRISLSGTAVTYTLPTIQYASTVSAPAFNQATVATNGATGQTLTITAQSASGTTSIGGNLVLEPGTGTSSNGVIQLANVNTATSANAGAASALPGVPLGYWITSVNGTSVKIPYWSV